MFRMVHNYNKKKTEKWSSEELAALRTARKENFGFFFDICGAYITGNVQFINACTLLFSGLSTFFCLLYTMYISFSNFAVWCETFHFAILAGVSNWVLMVVLYFRDLIDSSMVTIGMKFYNYQETLDEETVAEIKIISEEGNSRKLFMAKSFCYIFAVTIVFLLFRPLLEMATGLGLKYDLDIVNLPIRMWVPFNTDSNNYALFLVMAEQAYGIILITLLWMGLDTYQIVTLQEIITNLEICNVTLTNFEQRAIHLFKSRYGRTPNLGLEGDREVVGSLIVECLNTSVEHHHVIIKFFEDSYRFGYYPYLAIYITITILLLLAILLISTDDAPLQAKVSFSLFAIVYCIHYFIYCFLGESIVEKNDNIGRSIYRGAWYKWMKETKFHSVMLKNMGLKRMELSAGGFTSLSHESFSTMVNTAFSYYNVLQAARE